MRYFGKPFNPFDFANNFAVIGSRKASREELDASYELGRTLGIKGKTVISGLALGIDSQAHKGCLSVNGKTVALIANHHTEGAYPKTHHQLYYDIVKSKGGVLHLYDEPNDEPFIRGKFNKFQKRLAERSVINAQMCGTIFVVSDKNEIEGGTRYATWWGKEVLNRKVYRVDSKLNLHTNFKVAQGNIYWETELPLQDSETILSLTDEAINGIRRV